MARASKSGDRARPLSPHLQIYRWWLTMALSIAHRVTGSALAVGLLLLTWWLVALAAGPESFATVQAVMHNPLGGLVLFGYTFVLFLHMANGIRHLVWDAGYGYDKEVARQSSQVVIGAAVGLTLLTWILIFIVG
ncbi:MAG: succinate dehydrogenase, cytochrome b556 subunit [Geminicoccaceae bacterium]|nr:succinate dehydrogenase, cytochrome b556 subunit [Geminicoccaceae bacterium]